MKKRISKTVISVILSVSMVVPTMAEELPQESDLSDIVVVEEMVDESADMISVDEYSEEESLDLPEQTVEESNDIESINEQPEEVWEDDDVTVLEDSMDDESITESDSQEEIVVEEDEEDSSNLEDTEAVSEESLDEDGVVVSEEENETISEEGSDMEIQYLDDVAVSVDDNGVSNEELFEQYVDNLFLGDRGVAEDGGTLAGDRLTGVNRELYDLLLADIRKVASGERKSTIFTYSVDDMNWCKESGYVFNVKDYGYMEFNADNYESVAAKLISNTIGYDPDIVIKALMFDYPYELFWFDKTTGYTRTLGYSYNLGKGTITFPVAGIFEFQLYVASGYSLSGKLKTLEVDNSNLARVQKAVTNAHKVVNDNKDLGDMEKIYAYKDYICNAVEYDHEAVAEENHPYTDQWQLINVFDDNPTTNVVCEGYAKAYQYLCDMTDFADDDMYSVLISGYMSGGTGAGGHMWNHMRLPDGKLYLVDVTNCDSGSVGAPDALFLAGYNRKIYRDEKNEDPQYYFDVYGNTIIYYFKDFTLNLYSKADLDIVEAPTHDFSEYTNATLNYDWYATGISKKEGDTKAALRCEVSAVCKTCGRKVILERYSTSIPIDIYPTCTSSGKSKSGYSLSYLQDPLGTGEGYNVRIPSVTLNPLGHDFDEGVEQVDGTILKTCKRSGCGETITVGEPTATFDATVEKFVLEVPTGDDLIYNGNSKSATVRVADGVDGMGDITVKYAKYGEPQSSATTSAPVNAGKYDVYADVAMGSKYKATVIKLGDFTIIKATPSYTTPTGLTADCTQKKNSDVELPAGFSYVNPDASLEDGDNSVTVTYTPVDTANYEIVTDIEVTIIKNSVHSFEQKIQKAEPEETVPATCTEDGYFKYKYLCDKGCGAESEDTHDIKNNQDLAKGHDAGEWYSGAKICTVCGEELYRDENEPLLTVDSSDITTTSAKLIIKCDDGVDGSGIEEIAIKVQPLNFDFLLANIKGTRPNVWGSNSFEHIRDSFMSIDKATWITSDNGVVTCEYELKGDYIGQRIGCEVYVADKAGNNRYFGMSADEPGYAIELKKGECYFKHPEYDNDEDPDNDNIKIRGTYGQTIKELIDNVEIEPLYYVDIDGKEVEAKGKWELVTTIDNENEILPVGSDKSFEYIFIPDLEENRDVNGEADIVCKYENVKAIPNIRPKDINVTIDNAERDYNAPNPNFTLVDEEAIKGQLVEGDVISNLGISLSTEADINSDVGTYDITGTSNSKKYKVNFTNGTLTVKKADFTGSKECSGRISKKNNNTSTVTLPAVPKGATYSVDLNGHSDKLSAVVDNNKLKVTSKGIESDEDFIILVKVTNAKNYNDYEYKVTLTPIGGRIITFNPADGICSVETMETDDDGKLASLPTVSREGYTFKGWYMDVDGVATKISTSTVFTENVEVIAKWAGKKYTNTLVYNVNGGKNGPADSTDEVTYPDTQSSMDISTVVPTRTGYHFDGWYTEATGGDKVSSTYVLGENEVQNNQTATVYAHWIVNKYTIKFSGNGATSGSMSSMSCEYNTEYTLKANAFKKTGYKFNGWNTKADGSGTAYANKAAVKNLLSKDGSSKTLYAQWKKATYTITYELNGGKNSSSNPTKYNVETATITLKSPTRTGYTFKGWYNGSTKVTQIVKGSTGSITLTAKWKLKTGWVKYTNGWRYIHSNGSYTKSNWEKVDGKWYYFNASGYMQTGWIKLSGKWYYLNSGGDMAVGWVKVSGKWYYLNSGGDMAVGWVKVGGKWYYMNSNGVMQTGWIKLNGKEYYLYSDGHMAANEWIGNYHVNANGVYDMKR